MNWLAPSLVAIATTIFFVCPIYLYLYFQEREKSLAIWAVGWFFYGCRYLIQLGLVTQLIPPSMILLQQLCAVTGAGLFVYGTCYFIGRKFPTIWLLAAAGTIFWALIAEAYAFGLMVSDLPVFLFLCFAYVWSGYLILNHAERKGAANQATGWALILGGIHKADYPFLHTVSWFAPWGYLIASLLFLLASIGILLIYYERVRHHLENGKALLLSLIDSIPDLIFYKDRESVYLGCNQAFSKFLGRSRENIIGYRDHDFFNQEMADFFRAADLQMLNQAKPLHLEEWVPNRSGYPVLFDTLKTPYYDPAGRVLGLIGISRDITERKRIEEALKESEMLLNEVGEISRIGGWEMDLTTGRSKWTRATYEIVGIDPGEPAPGPDAYLEYYLPEYHAMIEQAVRQLIEQDTPLDFEAQLRTTNGEIIWCHTLGKAVREHGKCIKIFGTFQDISREKRAAAEKEALEKKFRQAQKMEAIGTLAGGIAHDFNNLLVPIIGYAEMVMDSLPADSRNRQDLQAILTAAKRARDLVKQILRFSREREQDLAPLLIGPIAKESIKLLSSSIPKNIRVNQEITARELTVLADASQIHQLMMNLGANAYQAMRETGGRLDFTLREAEPATLPVERAKAMADGRYLEIMVRDTGRGMDEATRDRIFEPYFTTRAKDEGTGLGLAVVHGIIRDMKGKIFVESEPGKGSSFYIYLPLFDQLLREKKSEPVEGCPTGTARILVVDDEKSITESMARRLAQLGYQVTSRTSSIEALELFRHRPFDFDLVLTDQTMPCMTGDQLGMELLAIRPDIPLILCTGYSSVVDQERARKIGFKAFLLKPIIRSEMARAIRMVLDGRADGL